MGETRLGRSRRGAAGGAGRREAVRALGAAGAAMWSALSSSAGAVANDAEGDREQPRGGVHEERKRRGKRRRHKPSGGSGARFRLTEFEGEPADIDAGQGATLSATCGRGVPISGGVFTLFNDQCFIVESFRSATTSSWSITVECPQAAGPGTFQASVLCLG